MTLQPLFQWIEATQLAMWINNSKYAFAVSECFHILALAIIGGCVIMVDARLLGFGFRNQKVSEVAAAARRGVVVAEVPPQRGAPAAGLVSVVDDGTEPAGVLPAEDLEATPETRHALDERLERNRRVDPIIFDALTDARLDERRHQRARRPL